MKTIYLDLDGPMANYDLGFALAFPGYDLATLPKPQMWKLIHSHHDFFANLPPAEGALEAYRKWLHWYEPIVLTACGSSNFPSVAEQKRRWVRKHLGPGVQIIPVQDGLHKPLAMREAGDILIDDWAKNTDAWTLAGGIAILHTNWGKTHAEFAEKYKEPDAFLRAIND